MWYDNVKYPRGWSSNCVPVPVSVFPNNKDRPFYMRFLFRRIIGVKKRLWMTRFLRWVAHYPLHIHSVYFNKYCIYNNAFTSWVCLSVWTGTWSLRGAPVFPPCCWTSRSCPLSDGCQIPRFVVLPSWVCKFLKRLKCNSLLQAEISSSLTSKTK